MCGRILRTVFTLTRKIAIVGMHCIVLYVRVASWLHFESGKGKNCVENVWKKFEFFIQKCVRTLSYVHNLHLPAVKWLAVHPQNSISLPIFECTVINLTLCCLELFSYALSRALPTDTMPRIISQYSSSDPPAGVPSFITNDTTPLARQT